MTQRLPVSCDSCLHRRTDSTCEAFPQGIPEDIVAWGDPHTEPTKDQKNSIVWAFKPGTEEQFENWKNLVEQRTV